MMQRATHYVPAGHAGKGKAPYCYVRDMRAHLDSRKELDDLPLTHIEHRWTYTAPPPKKTTDLAQVTCPECLREIGRIMARKTLARIKKGPGL